MRLTRYTDYSLRVLMYLALRPDHVATIEEISQAYGISKAHLMKVVHELGQAGLLQTSRGRGGGVRLLRAPEEITVGAVVRHTEPNLDLVECFDPGSNACRIEPACRLKHALDEALSAFLERLDGTTLADLVARRRAPLVRLLAGGAR